MADPNDDAQTSKVNFSDQTRKKSFGETFGDKFRKMSKIVIPPENVNEDGDSSEESAVIQLRKRLASDHHVHRGSRKRVLSIIDDEDILIDTLMVGQTIHIGESPNGPISHIQQLVLDGEKSDIESHPIFCEMLLLEETEETQWIWKESARWVKYEETVEEGGTRFSKPHITNLSIQSILQLRNCLKRGSSLLDINAESYKEVVDHVMHSWSKSRISQSSLTKITIALMASKQHLLRNRLTAITEKAGAQSRLNRPALSLVEEENADQGDKVFSKMNQNLLKKLPDDSESAVVLVGQMSCLTHPLTEFVRLNDAQSFPTLTEMPIPVRFIFFLLFPTHHEEDEIITVGKCMGTLMVDDIFSQVAYQAKDNTDLADGAEEFLSQTVIFPPGKWNPSNRLEPQDDGSVPERSVGCKSVVLQRPKHAHGIEEGLRRTGRIFGGFINDIKRKAPWYASDFTDMFRGRISQTLAASVFLFFANVTNIITFGAVMGQKLDGYMGAIENLLAGGLCGIVYALFAGQPLCILSATGPTLAFEAILYDFCLTMEWNYMPVRLWVGVWTAIFILVIVAFDATVIIALITRFTEEAFATLIAVIFIVDGFKELFALRKQAPLTTNPEAVLSDPCICNTTDKSFQIGPGTNLTINDCLLSSNATFVGSQCHFKPDVFLFSVLLFIGTYIIAMTLKKFREAPYLSGKIRQTISDFNVLIAIVLMTCLSILVGLDVPSLHVPSEFKPTRPGRGWLIDPFDTGEWWVIFAAAGPAFLLTILIFMDQQITSVIINRVDNKLKKGYGYHLDLFVLALLITICAFFGLPYYVSATVLGIMHLDALRLMSETAAPGEKPIFLGIKEQRMTALIAHIIIALSVLLTGVIRLVPMPVLLGIFFYMGVVTLLGQQFFQRFLLFFMPIKYQPDFPFLRLVKLSRVHFFTFIQLIALGLLFAVKTIKAISMKFPLMLIVTVLIRFGLERLFIKRELRALDDPMPELKSLFKPISRSNTLECISDGENTVDLEEMEVLTLKDDEKLNQ